MHINILHPAESVNGDQEQVGTGVSLSSKLQSCCLAPGFIAFCMIRLLQVPEGAIADGEGQGFNGAGEKTERVNSGHKQVKLFINYTHSPDCITDYPK